MVQHKYAALSELCKTNENNQNTSANKDRTDMAWSAAGSIGLSRLCKTIENNQHNHDILKNLAKSTQS